MSTPNELSIAFGSRIKAAEDGIVEGYLVPFTGPGERDLHGEYFDATTEISFDPDTAPVLYHHGHDGSVQRMTVGKFLEAKVTDLGVWVRAQLDMANQYAREIYGLAKRGVLAWSSGADQSALVDGNGHIERWDIREGSLTPSPAKPFSTRVTAKSLDDGGPSLKELLAKEGGDDSTQDSTAAHPEKANLTKESTMDALAIVAAIATRMGAKLSGEDLASIAAEISGVAPTEAAAVTGADEAMLADPARNAPIKSAIEVLSGLAADRVRTAVAYANAGLLTEFAEKAVNGLNSRTVTGSARAQVGGNGAGQPAPSQSFSAPAVIDHARIKSRLGNLSPEKLSWALDMDMRLARLDGAPRVKFAANPRERKLARQIAQAVFMAHASEAYDKGEYDLEPRQYEKAVSIARHFSKSNELDNTGQTGYGAEWVPESWATQIWRRARRENVVLSRIKSFEMTAPIMNWPTDGTDGEVFMVSEHTDSASFNDPVTAANVSKIPTSEVIFNTNRKKLQRQVAWTREQIEDSIIKFDSEADAQAMQSMIDALEYNLLLGDTETGTTNINLDGAAPASNKAYLAWDGIVKYALANTGVDMAGAAPTFAKIIEMLYKMNPEIVGDTKDTVMFTHGPVYGKLLQLDEFVTADVVGGAASNTTGVVREIAGVPTLRTQAIPKSATNGKISNTGGNNLYGRLVGVYLPYWMLGYRRRIGRKLAEAGDGESFLLTMTARASFKQHSDALGAALLYDIGV